MRLLKGLLWFCGLMLLITFPMALVSWSVVEKFYEWFGLAPLAPDALNVYFYRVTCASCGMVGIYFIIIALDPVRYLPLIRLTGWGMIFLGLVALVTGITVNMKPPWYIADGGICTLLGLLITVLCPKGKKAGS